ncbi:MAG: katE, partial [Acidimicrobiia bacterium]|nr:katE [Acidimicrobiia bacterium]
DDPLMQARLFSYLDTQLNRFGTPNFNQIPINRPLSPVDDNLRDGAMQQAVHHGRTPYLPNTVGGGCPFLAGEADSGYIHVPRPVEGVKTRERGGPDDEYAQATLFWNSMTEVEQDHIVDAFTFELSKVDVPAVVDLMIERLAHIDAELVARVAAGLGLVAPDLGLVNAMEESPLLAMVTEDLFPVDGRVVHILTSDGCDVAGVAALQMAIVAAGATPHVIATHKGAIVGADGSELTVDRSFHTASSAECDGLIVAGGTQLLNNPAVLTYIQSAYRHCKTVGAWGDGLAVLEQAGATAGEPGVISGDAAAGIATTFIEALSLHRHWERLAPHPTRQAIEA